MILATYKLDKFLSYVKLTTKLMCEIILPHNLPLPQTITSYVIRRITRPLRVKE